MNKQNKGEGRRGVEWTDFTWNGVGGCKHACRWQMPDGSIARCYAERVAEGAAAAAYPQGFDAHYYHPERLEEPLKVKEPSRIFLDSMADLMGHWVPDDQIVAVLNACLRAHWHSFQLLTKNAPRLEKFIFPKNVWVGVSLPPTFYMGKQLSEDQQARMFYRAMTALYSVLTPVRWVSFEPLSFDAAALLNEYTVGPAFNWAVIGAATNGSKTYQPKREWVEGLLAYCDKHKIPVFFKGNLEWPTWREEFPQVQVAKPAVALGQMEMF